MDGEACHPVGPSKSSNLSINVMIANNISVYRKITIRADNRENLFAVGSGLLGANVYGRYNIALLCDLKPKGSRTFLFIFYF